MSAPYIVPFNHEPAANVYTTASYTVPVGSYVRAHVLQASYAGNQTLTTNANYDVTHTDMARFGDAPIVRSLSMQTVLERTGVGTGRMRLTWNTRLMNIRNAYFKIGATGTSSTLDLTFETTGAQNVYSVSRPASSSAYSEVIPGISCNLINFFHNATAAPRSVDVFMSFALADYAGANPAWLRAGEVITIPSLNSVNLLIERYVSLT